MSGSANRRFSGFTCYAALCEHKASNIEEVSYQILLGKDKYFVSTDGGGERQQWFALIREGAGGVDPEPTDDEPEPKLKRLLNEFNNAGVRPRNSVAIQPRLLMRHNGNLQLFDESKLTRYCLLFVTSLITARGRQRRRLGRLCL